MANIQDIENVHTAGFEQMEVKFTASHDIKLNVSGIDINTRDGEILTIPRYVAELLEDAKHGTIQEEDMVVALKQASVKESVQGEFELATLDEHFYIKLRSYMKKLPERDYDKVESMLNTLFRKRRNKIVHLADSSKLTLVISKKMTVEEREFYDKLHDTSKKFTKQIMGENA